HIIDHGKTRWIVSLTERDERDARRARGRHFTLGFRARADASRCRRTAAARKLWQRCQRVARIAIAIDQRPEGARSHILAADEAQPVEPLIVGEMGSGANGHTGDAARGAETLMKRIPAPATWLASSRSFGGRTKVLRVH